MNFQADLASKVMAGEKTVTRRVVSENPRSPWWREKCALTVGRDYAVCPGRGKNQIGRILVTDVRLERILDISDDDVKREGFETTLGFFQAFAAINGHANSEFDPEVWRVEFTVVNR